MKKLFSITALLIMISANAQEPDPYVHRYVGIGIRTSVFQISELSMEMIPANRLMVSCDPIKYFRTEAHFAAYSRTDELFLGVNKFNLKERSTLFGIGVFGVLPYGDAKFLAGLRLSLNNYKEEYIRSDEFGNPVKAEDSGNIRIIAPAIGGEYFFSKWFSVGAEFSFMMLKDEFHPWDADAPDTTSTTNITESSLVFRFYPY